MLTNGNYPWHQLNFDNQYAAMLHIATSNDLPYSGLDLLDKIDEGAIEILKLCLQRDWKLRPSALELIGNIYLNEDEI